MAEPVPLALLVGVADVCGRKLERIAFTSRVVVAPPTILSGTFHPFGQLPAAPQPFVKASPIFRLTDGFHGGCLGSLDCDPLRDAAIAATLTANMVLVCVAAVDRGWGMRNREGDKARSAGRRVAPGFGTLYHPMTRDEATRP